MLNVLKIGLYPYKLVGDCHNNKIIKHHCPVWLFNYCDHDECPISVFCQFNYKI